MALARLKSLMGWVRHRSAPARREIAPVPGQRSVFRHRLCLLALVVSACSFPRYSFSSNPSSIDDGGAGGEVAGRAGAGGLVDAGGVGESGATGGDGIGGNGAGGAGASHSGGAAAAEAGAGAVSGTSGAAGHASGAAGQATGSAGAAAQPKTCADLDPLSFPAGCTCAGNLGHVYLFCLTELGWSQAASKCGFTAMALVKIESAAESGFVLNHAHLIMTPRPLTFFWIGASSTGSPGTWHWPDGSVFWHGNAAGTAVGNAYFNWRQTSPQNTTTAACVFMDNNGWEEGDCSTPRGYVCEGQ